MGSPLPGAAVALSLASACLEYEVAGHGNAEDQHEVETGADSAAVDTEGSPDDSPETCGERDLPEVPIDTISSCTEGVEPGARTLALEWSRSGFASFGDARDAMAMPAACPGSDGIPRIALVTYDPSGGEGVLRLLAGADGEEMAAVTGLDLQPQGHPACADLDGDGSIEFLVPTTDGVVAVGPDGAVAWRAEGLGDHIAGVADAPFATDLDGDGRAEVGIGRAIVGANGSFRGAGEHGRGGPAFQPGTAPAAADLDGDGIEEVVVGDAIYGPGGETLCYDPALDDGYAAPVDLDGDGAGEVVVSGGGTVRLQDQDCVVLWSVDLDPGRPVGGPALVVDLDADGLPEIGIATGDAYTVLDAHGAVRWSATIDDSSSGSLGSSGYDFDGDGVVEIAVADETRLWLLSGPTGAVAGFSDLHRSATWTEYPVIADFDGDGEAEIAAAQNGDGHGVAVWGGGDSAWQSGPAIWPQHALAVGSTNDDGTVAPPRAAGGVFRAAEEASPGSPGPLPDFVPRIEDACCEEDRIVAWVRVGNQGFASDGEVVLALSAQGESGRLALGEVTVPVPPAGWLGTAVRVEATLQPGVVDLVLESDSGGYVAECDESNNTATLGRAPCGG